MFEAGTEETARARTTTLRLRLRLGMRERIRPLVATFKVQTLDCIPWLQISYSVYMPKIMKIGWQ